VGHRTVDLEVDGAPGVLRADLQLAPVPAHAPALQAPHASVRAVDAERSGDRPVVGTVTCCQTVSWGSGAADSGTAGGAWSGRSACCAGSRRKGFAPGRIHGRSPVLVLSCRTCSGRASASLPSWASPSSGHGT